MIQLIIVILSLKIKKMKRYTDKYDANFIFKMNMHIIKMAVFKFFFFIINTSYGRDRIVKMRDMKPSHIINRIRTKNPVIKLDRDRGRMQNSCGFKSVANYAKDSPPLSLSLSLSLSLCAQTRENPIGAKQSDSIISLARKKKILRSCTSPLPPSIPPSFSPIEPSRRLIYHLASLTLTRLESNIKSRRRFFPRPAPSPMTHTRDSRPLSLFLSLHYPPGEESRPRRFSSFSLPVRRLLPPIMATLLISRVRKRFMRGVKKLFTGKPSVREIQKERRVIFFFLGMV